MKNNLLIQRFAGFFYTMNTRAQQLEAFGRLLDIMDELREKCPWDKKQTLESLSHLTIEEVYELNDAVQNNDLEEIKKELGDVLMHTVFYAKIASETNAFDIGDALHSISDKLVERHPHIYGDTNADTEQEVLKNWELLKLKQGNASVLGGVPKGLPALVKAMRIQEKASGVGFDWDNATQVWEKVQEEVNELTVEVQAKDQDKMISEFGDVLFSLVNYARFINVNPEQALERTNAKFINRFSLMETYLKEDQLAFGTLSLEELDVYWDKAKKNSL